MVTAGIGGAYLDVTHGMAPEVKLLPQASRNWREGDNDATFVQQPVTYPSLDDSRAWVTRLAQPWRKEWIVRRNPGVFTAFAITHFILFLVLLLIFWQGVRASETGAIIDAYLSATPRELFRFAGGLLAVVLLAFVICLLPMVRRRPPLLSIKAMVLILSQLVTACACFVGFGLLPLGHARLPGRLDQVLHRDRRASPRSAASSARSSSASGSSSTCTRAWSPGR